MRQFVILLLLATTTCLSALPTQIYSEEKTSTQYYPVGELGKSWTLPSDHLPVGGSVGKVHFVMWNILHTGALHHIVNNGQGLRDSFIMAANIPDEGSLTLRESVIIDQIFEMINQPTHPRSLIALEETSVEVYQKLQNSLPKNMQLFPPNIGGLAHGDVFIFDTKIFDLIDYSFKKYKCSKSGNSYMTLTLFEKNTGLTYRFIQSHVPGGPDANSKPARKELADAVMSDFNPQAITIIMGDMNRSPDYFLEDFKIAAANKRMPQPFQNLWIPYPTHINTSREASWIDNIFIANPYPEIESQVAKDASVLFMDLQLTLDLLESLRQTSQ